MWYDLFVALSVSISFKQKIKSNARERKKFHGKFYPTKPDKSLPCTQSCSLVLQGKFMSEIVERDSANRIAGKRDLMAYVFIWGGLWRGFFAIFQIIKPRSGAICGWPWVYNSTRNLIKTSLVQNFIIPRRAQLILN